MKTYRVIPFLTSATTAEGVEFVGTGPSDVFAILKDSPSHQKYYLWEDERCLGLIRFDDNGYWELC